MNKWYFLHRWNRKSHHPAAELEGRFTSIAQAVEYLREIAGKDCHGVARVKLGKPVRGVFRYDIVMPDGQIEPWAVKVRPLRIEDLQPDEDRMIA